MGSKSNGWEGSEWARAPPPTGPVWDRIARIFYDPADGSIFGRTPRRWGIALIFYTVFYAVLALLFALCMGGLFLTLDDTKPSFILESSLIGSNPGVAFRPRPADGGLVRITDGVTINTYVKELKEFLKPYQNDTWFTKKPGCSEKDNYGFPDSPCFFIKLNRIYGWKPDFYAANALPSDMGSELVNYISTLQPFEKQQVWISCWEETSNNTKIEYPWGMGLPGSFYPFLNEDGYNSPLIPVKLTPSVRNETAVVRCRAWAKNIQYKKSLKEPSGYTRILLQLADDTPASDEH